MQKKQHHLTLHRFSAGVNETKDNVVTASPSREMTNNGNIPRSLLPVVRVDLRNNDINRKFTAVLDSCSEINILSSRCCQSLGLTGDLVEINIIGVGGMLKSVKTKRVNLGIIDKLGNETKLECVVLSKACGRALKINENVLDKKRLGIDEG